jgi:glycosyltransferase involved in cell wall biosynthesis
VIRVGWLADAASYIGGAELTQAEFRAAAPDDVEIVDCPAGAVVHDLDRYAVHNCVNYTADDLKVIADAPAVNYYNDVGTWLRDDRRDVLRQHARPVCCSLLQAQYMGLEDTAVLIPPPVDLDRFMLAAAAVNGSRAGRVSVGSWRNLGKAPHRAAEWAAERGGVDFYGDGPFAPTTSRPVDYEQMPALLAGYETFVFLPSVLEPFGRLVVEAWAAGCALVINELVGAKQWLEHDPDAIRSAADDYWDLLLDD